MQNRAKEISEKNFMSLLNLIADPVAIVDETGRFLLVNNTFEDITGLHGKRIIGTKFLEVGVLTEESKALLMEKLKRRMQGLPVQPYEVTFKDKFGNLRYVEVNANSILYAEHPADLVIFRDITTRKANERRISAYAEKMEGLVEEKVKEIKQSEEKYRELTESISDVFFAVDKDLRITYWNVKSEELSGVPAKEAVGKYITEVLPNIERTDIEPFVQKVLTTRQAQSVLSAYKLGDREFFFEISVYPAIAGLSVFVKDITERKKMEAEVKQQMEMLESLSENLGVGLVVISKDYRVLWINRFIKNNVGDVTGKLCYTCLNTLDHVCPDCGVRKVFENGVTRDSHEYTNVGIHGDPYHVELIATPIKDKDGHVTSSLELVVDINEKKRLQKELTDYSQKLEKMVEEKTEELMQTQAKLLKAEKLAAIGELAGMVGHDLRNPLTGIQAAVYYLQTKHSADIGAKGCEMLRAISKAIANSNKIINDLLEYSGKPTLELTETTPKLLLEQAFSAAKIPERIKIVNAANAKPQVKVDIESMQKAFANIINNAIDSMPKTGTLTVTSSKSGENVKIVFADTGTGMTEDTLAKLKLGFPLFTTKARGMGFGLPISKRIIDTHGGSISIESVFGKGTTITVILPINPKLHDKAKKSLILQESLLRELRKSEKPL